MWLPPVGLETRTLDSDIMIGVCPFSFAELRYRLYKPMTKYTYFRNTYSPLSVARSFRIYR
jgi:hypothetical protein